MAGTYTTTTKYLLRKLTGGSIASDIDEGFESLAEDIDGRIAGYSQGTFAARPGAGVAGKFYRATDTGELFSDTGSEWLPNAWALGSLNSPWFDQNVALLTGQVAYRRELSGQVRLRGAVGGGASATAIFTLPSGYRPANTLIIANVTIATSGAITATGTSAALDGITFPVT